jgi:hypothetical protein
MMRILFPIFLVLIFNFSCFFAVAQKSDGAETINSFNFYYGTKIFKMNFSSSYNNFQNIDTKNAYKLVGIGANEKLLINRVYNTTSSLYFLKIIPEKIDVNDSTKYKSAGHLFGLTMFGLDLLSGNKDADLILTGGFDSGRIKLVHENGFKILNKMFAPKISFQTIFKFSKITIGMYLDYSFDISKKGWKRNDTSVAIATPLSNFNQSGLNTLFFIGISLE